MLGFLLLTGRADGGWGFCVCPAVPLWVCRAARDAGVFTCARARVPEQESRNRTNSYTIPVRINLMRIHSHRTWKTCVKHNIYGVVEPAYIGVGNSISFDRYRVYICAGFAGTCVSSEKFPATLAKRTTREYNIFIQVQFVSMMIRKITSHFELGTFHFSLKYVTTAVFFCVCVLCVLHADKLDKFPNGPRVLFRPPSHGARAARRTIKGIGQQTRRRPPEPYTDAHRQTVLTLTRLTLFWSVNQRERKSARVSMHENTYSYGYSIFRGVSSYGNSQIGGHFCGGPSINLLIAHIWNSSGGFCVTTKAFLVRALGRKHCHLVSSLIFRRY